MARVIVSTLIDATPAEVWEDVARLETHGEWMADVAAILFETDQRSGEGTRMRVKTRVGPFRTDDLIEVTEWDPPTRIGVVHRGLVGGTGAFVIEPHAAGTRFTWDERLRFPWYFGGPIGAWFAAPALRWVWHRNLGRLRARFSAL